MVQSVSGSFLTWISNALLQKLRNLPPKPTPKLKEMGIFSVNTYVGIFSMHDLVTV